MKRRKADNSLTKGMFLINQKSETIQIVWDRLCLVIKLFHKALSNLLYYATPVEQDETMKSQNFRDFTKI